MQNDLWLYYGSLYPGQIQVLGVDLWDGTSAQLQSFKNQTGATYPLLLCGTSCPGGNLSTLYGTYDNYIVMNKQGIVRYHAADLWPHGNRYHLDQIRGCVDSLVSSTAAVEDAIAARPFSLAARPSPFHVTTEIALSNPSVARPARITVLDPAGRRIVTPWEGIAPSGVTRATWDGRDALGRRAAAGVYLLRAEIGGVALTRRVVLLP